MNMMSDVDDAALRLFIKSQLRTDSDTQLRFIVRFADMLDMNESARYEWLYHKLFQTVRHGSQEGLTHNQQRRIAKLYSELLEQGKDALVQNHYLKTYHICVQGLIKIRIIVHRSKAVIDQLLQLYERHLKLLYALFDARLPPALTDEMHDFILMEYEREITPAYSTPHTLLRLWLRLKLRLEGDSCLKDDGHLFGLEYYDSLDRCERFYYTVLTEHWPDTVWQTIANYEHPSEILRQVLRRLQSQPRALAYLEEHLPALTSYEIELPS